jgi:hypothetical protein
MWEKGGEIGKGDKDDEDKGGDDKTITVTHIRDKK